MKTIFVYLAIVAGAGLVLFVYTTMTSVPEVPQVVESEVSSEAEEEDETTVAVVLDEQSENEAAAEPVAVATTSTEEDVEAATVPSQPAVPLLVEGESSTVSVGETLYIKLPDFRVEGEIQVDRITDVEDVQSVHLSISEKCNEKNHYIVDDCTTGSWIYSDQEVREGGSFMFSKSSSSFRIRIDEISQELVTFYLYEGVGRYNY